MQQDIMKQWSEREPVPTLRASHPDTLARRLLAKLPTLLILVLLGSLAYWGHHFGWTIPKFSELAGNAGAEHDDWCNEHRVPKSVCVECDPTLLPRISSTWCAVHGVHNCPFEHPEVAQTETRPEVRQADLDRARRALDLKDRPANDPKSSLHERRIQLASAELLTKMGIEVAPVSRSEIVEAITASGQISYDPTRVAPVYSTVVGRVAEILPPGRLGTHVKKGDVLALVSAVEVGKAKNDFLTAVAQLTLKEKNFAALEMLAPQGAVAASRLREAETAYREAQINAASAQQTLANLGLPVRLDEFKKLTLEQYTRQVQTLGIPENMIGRLDAGASANLLAVRAPIDGVVIEAKMVAGETSNPQKNLFVVADTSRMWLTLHVRSEDVKYLHVRDDETGRPGQPVRFEPDGEKHEVTGELVWKSTTVEARTHTVPFRADLPNPDGHLIAHTYGSGHIILRDEKDAIVVPSDAVHWDGEAHIVFVRDKHFLDQGAPKVFHVRTVRPGVNDGTMTEIIAGVLPGEIVATRNSASLRAELLKSRLGEAD
jgi:membrane fusion protein, heavy metal efflux system